MARWPGNWKFACHVCGFWYPSGKIQKRWDGAYVCDKDWEPRHPQTLIKVHGEKAVPRYVSKDIDPSYFVTYCDISTISAFADLGVADCMQADKTDPSYRTLLDLATNGHNYV